MLTCPKRTDLNVAHLFLFHVQAINGILFVISGDYKNHSRSIEMDTKIGRYCLLVGLSLGCVLIALAVLLWFYKPNQSNQTDRSPNSLTED